MLRNTVWVGCMGLEVGVPTGAITWEGAVPSLGLMDKC